MLASPGAVTFNQWWSEQPVVTRVWVLASLVFHIFGAVFPAITTLMPISWFVSGSGLISLQTLLHFIILIKTLSMLERVVVPLLLPTPMNLLWVLCVLHAIVGVVFVTPAGSCTTAMVLFMFCRLQPDLRMQLPLFGSRIRSLYYPLIMCGFHVVVFGGGLWNTLLHDGAGFIAGHIFVYFLVLRTGAKAPHVVYDWVAWRLKTVPRCVHRAHEWLIFKDGERRNRNNKVLPW
eukprot:PhM_4_TR10881/c0_g1_i1/m.34360/K11519/DERL1; Derlin-1